MPEVYKPKPRAKKDKRKKFKTLDEADKGRFLMPGNFKVRSIEIAFEASESEAPIDLDHFLSIFSRSCSDIDRSVVFK